MSDVQRWEVDGFVDGWSVDPEGEWVKYDDHVAAVAAAEQRGRHTETTEYAVRGYNRGFSVALGKARDAVAALQSMTGLLGKADALAAIDAIDALRGESNG